LNNREKATGRPAIVMVLQVTPVIGVSVDPCRNHNNNNNNRRKLYHFPSTQVSAHSRPSIQKYEEKTLPGNILIFLEERARAIQNKKKNSRKRTKIV
jgi:hypothetical protein